MHLRNARILQVLQLKRTVSKIGSKAFYNCKKLKNIKIKSKKLT